MKLSKYAILASTAALVWPAVVGAQDLKQPGQSASDDVQDSQSDDDFEVILVTATKRGSAKDVQEVPVSISAFGSDQLDSKHFQSLKDLSTSIPNVSMEDVGTTRGYANFSIRGQGINSSIPTVDPTVGVFVDGVYMGISAGVLFDTFDIEGIEVLRGPQGVLFGRNVTAGAVLVRTSTPTQDLRINLKGSIATGLDKTLAASVSGGLTEGLSAKAAIYYNDDDGYFTNLFTDNDNYGGGETLIVRPALRYESGALDLVARYEHGRVRGDGPITANRGLIVSDKFDVNIDEEGFTRSDWDQAILEANIDVAFGDGTITNIAAYRAYSTDQLIDSDTSPAPLVTSGNRTRQDQWSNELRYAGTFGQVDLTTGLYFFTQDIDYIDARTVRTSVQTGGGVQDQKTYGAFISLDWHISDALTFNLGGRYSHEKKSVKVVNYGVDRCDLTTFTCNYTFFDSDTWNSFTPKIGVQFTPDFDTLLYAYYSKGTRSGGYNLRNSGFGIPGPFDAENQDTFEIGAKRDFGSVLRINAAAFYNNIKNLQRTVIIPVPIIGTAQTITNTADAETKGIELEVTLKPVRGFTLSGFLGYVNGKYTDILFDLTGDGEITDADFALEMPRLAPWSYGVQAQFETEVGQGTLTSILGINYRDSSFYNDSNTGVLSAFTNMSASIAYEIDQITVSVFGKNLLDRVSEGINTPTPYFPGSTFTSLNKGRVIGAEIRFKL